MDTDNKMYTNIYHIMI